MIDLDKLWDHPHPHTLHAQVSAADIDGLNHTNNAVYVKWCEQVAWSHSVALGLDLDRYRELGSAKCCEIIRERIGDAPVYITFDLDCLDPTIAPAVSNLEPGCRGFDIDQAVELVQSVRGLNVVGGDVVCLMPTKDSPNKITSMVTMAIMFEMISLIADRHQIA